jgi:putative transposase
LWFRDCRWQRGRSPQGHARPKNKQRSYFARASGAARFVYNWALGEWQRQYRAGGKPTEMSLRVQLNKLKREQFPWMLQVTKFAVEQAIFGLGIAFRAFLEKRERFPRFKKKGVHDSFCAPMGVTKFRCKGRRIRLPNIGWVRMREALRFSGILKHVTVSHQAERWFASIVVDIPDIQPVQRPREAMGMRGKGVSAGRRFGILSPLSAARPIK